MQLVQVRDNVVGGQQRGCADRGLGPPHEAELLLLAQALGVQHVGRGGRLLARVCALPRQGVHDRVGQGGQAQGGLAGVGGGGVKLGVGGWVACRC